MKEQLIQILKNRGSLTIPEICEAISQEITEVRKLLAELLSEKMVRAFVEPNEFGCTGCPCGSCEMIPPKYTLV